MKSKIREKQLICMIPHSIHATAKKRAIDLDVKLKDYIAALIQYEVKYGTFGNMDIQELITSNMGDGDKVDV
jgi:hypothetical protein